MKILLFVGSYLPAFKAGGPIKTVKNLVSSLSSNGIVFDIITSDRDLGDDKPFETVKVGEWNLVEGASVYYVDNGFEGIKQIRRMSTSLDYDVLYLNSFFSFRFSILPQLFNFFDSRKIILAPRGEFSLAALHLKFKKKSFFIKLYKLFGLHRCIIFQASSKYEARDIQRVIGNTASIKIAENIGAQDFAVSIPHKKSTRTQIIVISRISPMKNLLQAIQILQEVKRPVDYHIYGPIEDKEYWSKCEAAIKQLPAHVKVQHKGSLGPARVIRTLAAYDMFFMPTLGENYGHVIAEAFCAGLPVLIADTTPWRQLETKGIGWDIPLNQSQKFVKAIDDFTELTDAQYHVKRQKILEWAKHKFSQRDTIEANIAMFKYAYDKSRKQ